MDIRYMIIRIPIGAPQGCVLGPLLFFLLTYNNKQSSSVSLSLLMTQPSVTAHSVAVKMVTSWLEDNNLSLSFNVTKTKDMILNYRKKQRSGHLPIHIGEPETERCINFRFLWVQITSFICQYHKVCHNVMSIKAKGRKSI